MLDEREASTDRLDDGLRAGELGVDVANELVASGEHMNVTTEKLSGHIWPPDHEDLRMRVPLIEMYAGRTRATRLKDNSY